MLIITQYNVESELLATIGHIIGLFIMCFDKMSYQRSIKNMGPQLYYYNQTINNFK